MPYMGPDVRYDRPMRWTGLAWAAACVALVTCVAAAAGAAGAPATGGKASPVPGCTCAEARRTDGWCEVHRAGYVAKVRIPSRLLYDTLDAHGHDLDLSTFTCTACREAIRTEGFCEEHRNGFVRKQAYFSRLTYEMARGERLNPDRIDCHACRKHAKRLGWCDRDGRGIPGTDC